MRDFNAHFREFFKLPYHEERILLMQGGTILGYLTAGGSDQPWFLFSFDPTQEYNKVRDVFEGDFDRDFGFSSEATDEQNRTIYFLNIYLSSQDGRDTSSKFVMKIRESKAWIRPWPRVFLMDSLES